MPPTDVLVFGEDNNDRQAVAHLVRALIPENIKTKITPLRKPIVLSRDAQAKKRTKMSDDIASFAKAYEKAGKNPAVVVHRDCDAIEPAHVDAAKSLEKDLSDAGVKSFAVATPAWEIEAWWMLFPDAVGQIRSGWRRIDYGRQHVGMFVNAKERLTRDLRPAAKSAKCTDFHESDGIRIAEIIAKDRTHLAAARARSDSFTAFKQKLQDIFAT